jgi:hypothetical protein
VLTAGVHLFTLSCIFRYSQVFLQGNPTWSPILGQVVRMAYSMLQSTIRTMYASAPDHLATMQCRTRTGTASAQIVAYRQGYARDGRIRRVETEQYAVMYVMRLEQD